MDAKNDNLITVIATGRPASVALIKSLLEEANILYLVKSEGVQNLFGVGGLGTGYNTITGPVEFQVKPEDEAKAREILSQLEENLDDSDQASAGYRHKRKLKGFFVCFLVGMLVYGFWAYIQMRKIEKIQEMRRHRDFPISQSLPKAP